MGNKGTSQIRSTKDKRVMAAPLIAVVCDIRGFTDFTASIDALNKSDQVAFGVKQRLQEEYAYLVQETQKIAVEQIFTPLIAAFTNDSEFNKPFNKHYGGDDTKKLPCALKSTGDGYLIAVNLSDDENFSPYEEVIQRKLALYLTAGVVNLVETAGLQEGAYRQLLTKFFNTWEYYLAIRLKPETFRIAGALSIGTGQVSGESLRKDSEMAKVVRRIKDSNCIELMTDAFGHGVNLAFRLCDRSGRRIDESYVLLDRRIGHLLIEENFNEGKVEFIPKKNKYVYQPVLSAQSASVVASLKNYDLQRVSFDREPLKGIDELWCYGLSKEEGGSVVEETRTVRVHSTTELTLKAMVHRGNTHAVAIKKD